MAKMLKVKKKWRECVERVDDGGLVQISMKTIHWGEYH